MNSYQALERQIEKLQEQLKIAQEREKQAVERYRAAEERSTALTRALYRELVRTEAAVNVTLEESDRLLEGLRGLTETLDLEEMWRGIIQVLQPVLEFDHACVLMFTDKGELKVIVATTPVLRATIWRPDAYFGFVLSGQTEAVADIAQIPEWQAQLKHVQDMVGSALHVALQIGQKSAILICTHPQRNYFRQKHTALARRFTVMIAQALHNAELYTALREERDKLEERVQERTVQLVTQRDFAMQVMNTMGQGLMVSDANGRFEFVNLACAHMLGYEPTELIGKIPGDITIETDRVKVQGAHQQSLAGEVITYEAHLRKANNHILQVLITETPRMQNNRPVGTISVITDLTEQIKTQRELEQAKEMAEQAAQAKANFMASMSHEIRTPLNAVIGLTSLLLDTKLTLEQREYAETARRSGNALLVIINDILDFSKIEAGKLELEKQPFSLDRCLQESVSLVAQEAKEKRLKLAYDISETVPDYIEGDITRLLQILVNLLSNAIKFTQQGQVLVLVTGHLLHDGLYELHFRVKDTGIGIPLDRMSQLFQPFSQVDVSTTRKYGGTGLGLAICDWLVSMMNGRLWIESQLGKGSTFHFTICAQPATASSVPPMQNPTVTIDAHMGQRHPLRILLVEDNVINQKVAMHMLRRLGYWADLAANGLEAVEAVRRQTYDVIFMDIQMPEMDGVQATGIIKQECPANKMPRIVAMTANVLATDRQKYQEAGMDDYLSKPVNMDELIRVLDETTPVVSSLVTTANSAPFEAEPRLDIPISIANFERIMGPDTIDLLDTLLQIFLEETPRLIEQIQQAVVEENGERLRKLAHSLWGSSASVAALHFSALSYDLELMGKTNDLRGAGIVVSQLETEFARIEEWVVSGQLQAHL